MSTFASKIHIDLIIKSQNSTIQLIYDVPSFVRNFYFYKDTNISRFNEFVQRLNINFHLSLADSENSALSTLSAYDIHDNSIVSVQNWELS